MSQSVRHGDLFWANLDPTVGVEIQKTRPVVVVSNDAINQHSRLVIVVPLTTNTVRLSPSHVLIPQGEGGLGQDSKALTEQIRAMDSDSPSKLARCRIDFCGSFSRRSVIPWICEEANRAAYGHKELTGIDRETVMNVCLRHALRVGDQFGFAILTRVRAT